MKKVLLITEYINPPFDEGIKKTVYNLFLDLDKRYDLQVICRFGFKKNNIHIVKTNPLFYSAEIRSIFKSFRPEVLIYLPFQSSTFASYLRLEVLSFFAKKVKTIFIALQPKPLRKWQQFMIRSIKPEFSLTPSPSLQRFWAEMNINSQLIPLLTDLKVFKPINNLGVKQRLRKKYNLPVDVCIVTHMGHLNEGRNLKSLIPLQKNRYQVVIVGSSSTPQDALGKNTLKDELKESGIIIIDAYIEHIEEIYQLSDLYIFPVERENSSIGMPLSILEARACGIPVLTTDYGSIKYFLGNDYDGIAYAKPKKFLDFLLNNEKFLQMTVKDSIISELNDLFYDIIHKSVDS